MCVIGTTSDGCHTWHRRARESVSDSGYGHEHIPCMTYDIHVDIFTWMCMGWVDHCIST